MAVELWALPRCRGRPVLHTPRHFAGRRAIPLPGNRHTPFHLTIELGKVEGEDVYKRYYDEMGDKRATPRFTAKGIALFYYDGTKAGSYMLAYPQKNAIISMEGAF